LIAISLPNLSILDFIFYFFGLLLFLLLLLLFESVLENKGPKTGYETKGRHQLGWFNLDKKNQ